MKTLILNIFFIISILTACGPSTINNETPKSTITLAPTVIPTLPPKPIILSGSGDSVVDFDKWDDAALAHINYSGAGNFVVWNYDSNGEKIDLLVNTIGKYDGTRPIDFIDGEDTARFRIKSSGKWTIQILPLIYITKLRIPGIFKGTSDDVIFLEGANPDLLIADASNAKSNFVIFGYGNNKTLLINDIAPYKGTVILNKNTFVLIIKAEGIWSIEIKTK